MSEAAAKPPRMTVDEFIVWSQTRPGRYELLDGEVVTMQTERIGHVRAKGRVFRLLSDLVERAQIDCTVLQDGAAVRVDEEIVYEPDCTIHCGPIDDSSVFASNPVVIVEVLSRSTQALDTGIKLAGYFRIPSVQHYLVVDASRRVLVHFHRKDGEIASRIFGTNWHDNRTLVLDPPGITVPINGLFADLSPVDPT